MPHPDADDLALLALGESLGSAIDTHAAGCAACTAEIQLFRETVDLADLNNYGEDAPRPGEHVWAAIATELGFTDAERVPHAAPGITMVSNDTRSDQSVDVPAGPTDPAARLHVVPDEVVTDVTAGSPSLATGPSPRRWSRWAAPLAAAVVGIAVGAGAVVVSQNRADEVTVEATAPLTPVAGGPLTNDQQEQLGKAELVAAPTGQEVRVNAGDLPPSANSYEVWLFGDDGRMVSLGTLSDGSGSFVVPEGISTREYRVVDVSDEPPDGNPLHSGISLIRGSFT